MKKYLLHLKEKFILSIIVFILLSSSYLSGQSIKYDQVMGEENAKMVEAQMGLYDDQEMTTYLNKVGNKLVSNLEKPLFDYQFHLVPGLEPNAFALPGGYIYVTTGLIPLFENEDEFACILAHEIIHSNNRHSIKQIRKSILPSLLKVPGNLLGVVNNDLGELFNAPLEISNSLLFASYSRKFETEADNEGVALAAASGYSPKSMSDILIRMSYAIEIATGQKEQKSYFDDHPYTPDRNNNIKKQIVKYEIKHSKPVSDNFLKEFDGILFGTDPAFGVIEDNKFLHPVINFFIEFPKGWKINNRPTNVGAYHPNGKAAVFFSIENKGLNPQEAGKVFLTNLEEEYKSKLSSKGEYVLNSKKGYIISFTEKIEKITMYADVLWLPLDDKIFKIIGISPIEYRKKLETSAASLRNLTKEEKMSIKQNYIKLVKASKNETIESLSKRLKNKLNPKLTAIINSHNLNDKLKEGELIKIVLDKPFLSE